MKHLYKVFFISILCALVACGDDDDPHPRSRNISGDGESPKINLLSPAINTTFLVINQVSVLAGLSDNLGLRSARTLLVDATGKRQEVGNPMVYANNTRFGNYLGNFYLNGIEPGDYTLVVEAKDQNNNMAKDSVLIKVHAPDISRAEFTEAFQNVSFFNRYDWVWLGLDYMTRMEFTEFQFAEVIHLMVNWNNYMKEHEWEKFMQDFRFKNQSWSNWDASGDGELDEIEFYDGLKRLNIFREWDTDHDLMIRKDEFAQGIFTSWDLNQDDMLTKSEYQDKYYYYVSILRD